MLILALSSSSPIPSAALCRDGEIIGFARGGAGRAHAETLMPLMESLLDAQGLRAADMDAFAADAGPGSFTGVRIGLSAVNAMAAATGKGVYGICALEAMCFGRAPKETVCAMLDARNESVYAALYRDGVCLGPPCAKPVDEVLRALPAGAYLLGDGVAAYRARIAEMAGAPRFFPDSETAFADAAAIARTAHAHAQAQAPQKEAYPLYLRASQAERKKAEKDKQGGGER